MEICRRGTWYLGFVEKPEPVTQFVVCVDVCV